MNSIEYEAIDLLSQVYDFTTTGDHFLEERKVNLGDAVMIFDDAWHYRLVDSKGEDIWKGYIENSTLLQIASRANDKTSSK